MRYKIESRLEHIVECEQSEDAKVGPDEAALAVVRTALGAIPKAGIEKTAVRSVTIKAIGQNATLDIDPKAPIPADAPPWAKAKADETAAAAVPAKK